METKDIPYNIHQSPIEKSLHPFLRINSFSKVAVLVDENTKQHCYPLIEHFLPEHTLIQIDSGETNKNLDTCSIIWQTLTNEKFDRKSLLINLGGGVIGDMGGFCASTYKRGIAFVQIPTTLLSQVDASVGGKLGIDFHDFKNQIGVFSNPQSVFIDVQFLNTLDQRQFKSGLAEVIKHALIRDKIHYEYLQVHLNNLNIDAVVERSVEIKKNVVLEDFEENGPRKILNFGHTVGHAIESFLLKGPNAILHGEAVAAGMICESHISFQLGLISENELSEIRSLLMEFFGKVSISENHFSDLLNLMLQDKKNQNAKISFSLLNGIGNACFDQFVEESILINALQYYVASN